MLNMRAATEVDERAASVDCATPPIGDTLLDEVQLVWAVLEHLDEVGLDMTRRWNGCFFLMMDLASFSSVDFSES